MISDMELGAELKDGMSRLQAGSAVTIITPPLGTQLSGSFEYREAETVDDDLTVRALVLDNGATCLALIICDLIAIPATVVEAARSRIAVAQAIPPSQIMISCTHTHTGPATTGLLAASPDPAYLEWLVSRIVDSVVIAGSRRIPARVAWGVADTQGVCFNRRFRMRDGAVIFNPPFDDPDVLDPVGPVDPQLTALLVEDQHGTPVALWANLALHFVGHDNFAAAVSADYYGDYARAVQSALGDQCHGLLTNGASADINNRDLDRVVDLPLGTKRARLVGLAVAATAIQATMMQRRHDALPLAAKSIPFTVARRPITHGDVALAQHILAGAMDIEAPAGGFSFVVGQPIPADKLPTYARETLALAAMPAGIKTELQVMRIGDLALVGLPGEVFVQFGLAIKARSPFPRTTVVSLANDYIGYIPTHEAFRQGGYETWAARSAWPAEGTGEAMVEVALAGLRALRGDLSEAPP
jgi:neutral ceramidase